MKCLLVGLLVLIGSVGCEEKAEHDMPFCIANKVADPVCLVKVTRFTYKGEEVYFFNSDCPDMYQSVYDNECELVCHPSGGFSGGFSGAGDGQCPDFLKEATDEFVVWEAER